MADNTAYIDLEPFCSIDPDRTHLHRPWSRNGYTYATDGRVMVRVPLREDEPGHEDAPDGENVLNKLDFSRLTHWSSVELPAPELDICSDCKGGGSEHECPHCQCACLSCNGTGMEFPFGKISVSVRGVIVDAKYLGLIQTLPGLKLPSVADSNAHKGIPFLFDGGMGALCARTAPADQHIEKPPLKEEHPK